MSGAETTEVDFAVWKLIATFIFVLMNGFFVATEFALVKIRPSHMEALAQKGNRSAGLAVGMSQKFDLYLSACQLGITVASLILGWLAEPAVAALLVKAASAAGLDISQQTWVHPVALGMALVIVTLLHMTVGEQAPKMFSIQKSEATILAFAFPLYLFASAFRPLIWFINWLSNSLVRLTGSQPASEHQHTYDLAELHSILHAAAKSGHLSPRQKLFSENILGLAELEVRHIMVPRTDVVYLSTVHSLQHNLKLVRKTAHSRYPLGDPDLDQVLGIVHSRTLLAQLLDKTLSDLKATCRPCPSVPDTQPLSRLILELQSAQTHCALVIDEHGTMVGLAFLEDAIEEIVGPIYDEFDTNIPLIKTVSPTTTQMLGRVPLPEAAHLLGIDLPDDACDTIGGLVVSRFKRLPQRGESIHIGPYKATVMAISRRRVTQVQFEKSEPENGRVAK